MSLPPFHLAFPVVDLERTRSFYTEILGCSCGRESESWIDFNFYGHQIVAHLAEQMPEVATNRVDGKDVPAYHFGVVLEWEQWQELAQRLQSADVSFLIEPYVRFEGEPGEQATMFIEDPSGNGLEFKSFREMSSLFAK